MTYCPVQFTVQYWNNKELPPLLSSHLFQSTRLNSEQDTLVWYGTLPIISGTLVVFKCIHVLTYCTNQKQLSSRVSERPWGPWCTVGRSDTFYTDVHDMHHGTIFEFKKYTVAFRQSDPQRKNRRNNNITTNESIVHTELYDTYRASPLVERLAHAPRYRGCRGGWDNFLSRLSTG